MSWCQELRAWENYGPAVWVGLGGFRMERVGMGDLTQTRLRAPRPVGERREALRRYSGARALTIASAGADVPLRALLAP